MCHFLSKRKPSTYPFGPSKDSCVTSSFPLLLRLCQNFWQPELYSQSPEPFSGLLGLDYLPASPRLLWGQQLGLELEGAVQRKDFCLIRVHNFSLMCWWQMGERFHRELPSVQCWQLLLSQRSNGVCLAWREQRLLKLFSIPSETNKCYSIAWHNWAPEQCPSGVSNQMLILANACSVSILECIEGLEERLKVLQLTCSQSLGDPFFPDSKRLATSSSQYVCLGS